MPILTLRSIQLSFGGDPLLEDLGLTLEPRERIALVGRNGTGKSTLLRVVAGEMAFDSGERTTAPGLKVGMLVQDLPTRAGDQSVYEVVAAGLGDVGAMITEYHRLSLESGESALRALGELQHRLEALGGWQWQTQVDTVLSRLGLDGDAAFASLSGGTQRRTLLARALVVSPDLLILDEPTNHLDIDGIEWLEGLVRDFPGTVLFVTHDRRFLEQTATRILELDRGRLTDWPGDYANYLRRRDERWHAEALAQAHFDRHLAQEEVWIRQGIQARRTRNEGRVRTLETLRLARLTRRERSGAVRMTLEAGSSGGRLVVEAEQASFAWDGRPIIQGLSTRILRGDRVGLIGPNGAGKTTLLQLLLGQIAPQQGSVRLGTSLQIAYFDQRREILDAYPTVRDAVGEGSEQVNLQGKPRHVLSYLKDFLFSPERARQPIHSLSGGERSRLMLARLFTRPANLLVLDEPTNDLDIETLELLEERLGEFPGTLLLVSHDRAFLDRVVTSTLVLEGQGRVGEYVGGYQDWLRQRPTAAPALPPTRQTAAKRGDPGDPPRPRKRGFKEQRELAELPTRIEALEGEKQQIEVQLADPALYRQGTGQAGAISRRLTELDTSLTQCYARWAVLEALGQDGR
ncbi:MAG: ATP-binding cassette domain-containing protein [Pseudomonadota bacterium]